MSAVYDITPPEGADSVHAQYQPDESGVIEHRFLAGRHEKVSREQAALIEAVLVPFGFAVRVDDEPTTKPRAGRRTEKEGE